MSYSGLKTFNKNISTLMESDIWKTSDDVARMNLGYKLLNSKYGIGSSFWNIFSNHKVKELKRTKS